MSGQSNEELSRLGVAAGMEAKRLAEKYNKDSFDMEDIMRIFNIGMHNARKLMMSKDFPLVEIGGRKVIPALALALWLASLSERIS